MRYGICSSTAASPMPPLPRRVVASPNIARLVATPGLPHGLPPAFARATLGAVAIAAVTPRANDHPGPATCAGKHSMTVHEDRLASRTGQECLRCATLLRADVAGNRGVC